jgi:hypothetical protein
MTRHSNLGAREEPLLKLHETSVDTNPAAMVSPYTTTLVDLSINAGYISLVYSIHLSFDDFFSMRSIARFDTI